MKDGPTYRWGLGVKCGAHFVEVALFRRLLQRLVGGWVGGRGGEWMDGIMCCVGSRAVRNYVIPKLG